jgi:hypothetical protein
MTIDIAPCDLSEESFAVWRNHPATKAFIAYLADYAAALERDHVERWKQGGAADADLEAEARGRVLTLHEIVDLRHDNIDKFYHQETEENDPDEGQNSK